MIPRTCKWGQVHISPTRKKRTRPHLSKSEGPVSVCCSYSDFTASLARLMSGERLPPAGSSFLETGRSSLSFNHHVDAHGPSTSSATNAKPRDQCAGLHRVATCRGLISSRHRDACRPVVTGFSVVLLEVSSIGPSSFQYFTLGWPSPQGFKYHNSRCALGGLPRILGLG